MIQHKFKVCIQQIHQNDKILKMQFNRHICPHMDINENCSVKKKKVEFIPSILTVKYSSFNSQIL